MSRDSSPGRPHQAMRAWLAWPVKLLRNRSLLLLLVAGAFGVLAAGGARGYIAERVAAEKERLNPPREMVDLVVAKADLPAGAVVDVESMAIRQMPAEFAPGGAISPDRFDQVAGLRLLQPMRSGEPLLPALIDPVRESVFSTRIRHGIRAMTIQVDEVNSVSGMLQPGDRIDLLFTVRPPSMPGMTAREEVTVPLVQDLAILATGHQVSPSDDPATLGRRFTSITVEVDPEQAQRLIVAQRSGRLTAMLRNPEDRAPVAATPLDVATLLGIRTPVPQPARTVGTELIVGGRGSALQAVEQPAFPGDLR